MCMRIAGRQCGRQKKAEKVGALQTQQQNGNGVLLTFEMSFWQVVHINKKIRLMEVVIKTYLDIPGMGLRSYWPCQA